MKKSRVAIIIVLLLVSIPAILYVQYYSSFKGTLFRANSRETAKNLLLQKVRIGRSEDEVSIKMDDLGFNCGAKSQDDFVEIGFGNQEKEYKSINHIYCHGSHKDLICNIRIQLAFILEEKKVKDILISERLICL